ncbi:hypothetical protein Patl1_32950 [Pistacia atlantica]|uniref:Uncharacterized protein n=1 Tax=Pistacia atlantica TaxID=434234 RepID=A0ACC1ARW1_9ROSI|nr:hypothetical protein Patl1_32950 [Pistacia atlantica]
MNVQKSGRYELPLSLLACSCRFHTQCRFDISILVFVPRVIRYSFFTFELLLHNLVQNAEVLCLGLVSVAVFMLVMPLFKTTGGILLQMAPPSIPASALSKCWRQVTSHEDVSEVSEARFWELVPGHVVGSISLQVKEGTDDRSILQFVHGLYHDLGIQDLTVQTDY